MSSQPDFRAQKIWIEEVLEKFNILAIFYPKFHCELNFIEMIWNELKSSLRSECSFSFSYLRVKLLAALKSFPVPMARGLQFCLKYMDGYLQGLSGPEAKYALTQYHGHRMLPRFSVESVKAECAEYLENRRNLEHLSLPVLSNTA